MVAGRSSGVALAMTGELMLFNGINSRVGKLLIPFVVCIPFFFLSQSQALGDELTENTGSQTKMPSDIVSSRKTTGAIFCAKDKPKGSVIEPEDLTRNEISVEKFPMDAINVEDIAYGRMVHTNLEKGSLIRLRDLGITMLPNCPAHIPCNNHSPADLVYAARRIRKGSTVMYDDLDHRLVPLNEIPAHSLVSPYAAVDRIAVRNIKKGSILYVFDFGIPY